jgi:triosephosphate isomerase
MKEEQIDGVLLGGASLKLDSFSSIIRTAAEVKKSSEC